MRIEFAESIFSFFS